MRLCDDDTPDSPRKAIRPPGSDFMKKFSTRNNLKMSILPDHPGMAEWKGKETMESKKSNRIVQKRSNGDVEMDDLRGTRSSASPQTNSPGIV